MSHPEPMRRVAPLFMKFNVPGSKFKEKHVLDYVES
jgi:hypothetical protein